MTCGSRQPRFDSTYCVTLKKVVFLSWPHLCHVLQPFYNSVCIMMILTGSVGKKYAVVLMRTVHHMLEQLNVWSLVSDPVLGGYGAFWRCGLNGRSMLLGAGFLKITLHPVCFLFFVWSWRLDLPTSYFD